MLRYRLVTAALVLTPALFGQVTARLSGHVVDADTRHPLGGATVEVLRSDSTIASASTDSSGAYRFETLAPGIVALRVRLEGHLSSTVPEVWVRTGRTELVDVELRSATRTLREVEVQENRPRHMGTIGEQVITVEQSLRYPATFFDPVRTVDTHAGIARTNDQANHFSVRGNGPGSNAWLLEGAEIVTPNHLTNAGTASDMPVISGGGVTILSAQMLGTSRLLMGSPEVAYGDALGGIMDMRLRRGANDRAVHTVQAGLIGIDLATEGPFKKGGGASYLVNYRYSTVGLLGLMGVNLGDEAISFQDLSFHVSLPFRRGSVSLFGLGGLSSNRFEAVEDSTKWEYDKDSQNINYSARMGAAGGTLKLLLGGKAVWSTTAVLSEQDQQRDADGILADNSIHSSSNRLDERKMTIVSHVRGTMGKRLGYQIGGSAMERDLFKSDGFKERTSGWLVRPYAQGSFGLGANVRAVLGLAASCWSINGSAVAEPRLSLTWDVGRRDAIMLSAGQRSQLPATQNYWMRHGTTFDNTRIGLVRSQDASLAMEHAFTEGLLMRCELFVQHLLDVPVIDTAAAGSYSGPQGYSMADTWDDLVLSGLKGYGTATNSGAEVSLRQRFDRGMYYHVNGTVLQARTTDAFGRMYDSRWNTGFIANAIFGREFSKRKEKLTRTWGVNARANVSGGQRYMPAPDEGKGPWEGRYATYKRVDLRVYLKREHAHRTGMWALDLQNAFNFRNEAFRYFDQRQRAFVMRYQLGIIPNLSYRIEF